MTAMNSLIKVPELQANMMNMAREMEKSGMISEIMQESLDDVLDVDEDAVDNEVENVLFELTAGELGKAPAAATGSLPVSTPVQNVAVEEDDVAARMAALKN